MAQSRCFNCRKSCPPRHLMCRDCWFRVPKHLRDRVNAAYTPGQEKHYVRPTREWLAAATEARDHPRAQG